MARNFKNDTVVYQIYPRSFRDSNKDGIGDIPGIIEKLDYIASLGVNTIWLSPVYKSPDDDNGYDISDYRAIQPHFGTMEDFDRLIAEAKARGIGIIMDLVINHTSDEHEWFRRALAGEEKYKNYYIIRKGEGGKLPNNWGNFFGECPWTPFGQTGEYYLHLFSKKQPDLNWDNPEVYREIVDIMKFWLDRGVAGFRCDVINVIHKKSLENGKPRFILTGQEHYLSTEGCHKILRHLRRDALEPYGAWAVGETVFVDLERARDLSDEDRGELDMVFSFEHMEVDQVIVKWFKTKLRPKKLMQTLTKWQNGLSHNAIYFENHDQPRFINRFSDSGEHLPAASKLVAGLLTTLRGTPFLYEGQELGMTNGDFADMSEIMDIESHNIYGVARKLGFGKRARWKLIRRTSRDNARTPMQWSAEKNGGFTDGTPWLKVNQNHISLNVRAQEQDPNSPLSFYKRMIRMRKEHMVLKEGGFRSLYEGKSIYAYERAFEGERYLCIFNFSGKKRNLPGGLPTGQLLVSSMEHPASSELAPFEFRMIKEVR